MFKVVKVNQKGVWTKLESSSQISHKGYCFSFSLQIQNRSNIT